MMPDGRPCAQCSALSIASHTLIPRSVGTGRRARMKVAFHESDCCFNWSPEPQTPTPTPSFGTAYFSPLIFLLLSSGGAWSLSPSAAKACTRRQRWQRDGTRSLPRGRLRLFKSNGGTDDVVVCESGWMPTLSVTLEPNNNTPLVPMHGAPPQAILAATWSPTNKETECSLLHKINIVFKQMH